MKTKIAPYVKMSSLTTPSMIPCLIAHSMMMSNMMTPIVMMSSLVLPGMMYSMRLPSRMMSSLMASQAVDSSPAVPAKPLIKLDSPSLKRWLSQGVFQSISIQQVSHNKHLTNQVHRAVRQTAHKRETTTPQEKPDVEQTTPAHLDEGQPGAHHDVQPMASLRIFPMINSMSCRRMFIWISILELTSMISSQTMASMRLSPRMSHMMLASQS